MYSMVEVYHYENKHMVKYLGLKIFILTTWNIFKYTEVSIEHANVYFSYKNTIDIMLLNLKYWEKKVTHFLKVENMLTKVYDEFKLKNVPVSLRHFKCCWNVENYPDCWQIL